MRYLFLLLTSFILSGSISAQGIEFFHGTWDEALEKSKVEERPIFVDCYTTWCGPCKRMAKQVFTQPAVGEFYNDNYINVKIDMESKMGRKFGSKYPVQAYPTLYFIDAAGEVLHKIKGGQQAEGLLQMGKFVLGKVDYSADYAKQYEGGDRDPELILNYVKALNKSNKSSSKVANEYLRSQKDLNTEFNQNFIFEAVSEADSRIFDLMIENKASIVKVHGEKAVAETIEKACLKTAQKAIEFESEDLLVESQDKIKKYIPSKSREFIAVTNLDFHKNLGNTEAYRKCCKDYVKKQIGNDAKELNELAKSLMKSFAFDEDARKDAEKYAKKASDNEANINYYLTYASILDSNGKKSEAVKVAKKALDIVGDDKRAQMSIQQFIEKVQQG